MLFSRIEWVRIDLSKDVGRINFAIDLPSLPISVYLFLLSVWVFVVIVGKKATSKAIYFFWCIVSNALHVLPCSCIYHCFYSFGISVISLCVVCCTHANGFFSLCVSIKVLNCLHSCETSVFIHSANEISMHEQMNWK